MHLVKLTKDKVVMNGQKKRTIQVERQRITFCSWLSRRIRNELQIVVGPHVVAATNYIL